eukprot:g6314.t1
MASIHSQVIASGKYGTGPTVLISVNKRQALGGEIKRVKGYLFNASEGLQRIFKEKRMKLKHIEQLLLTSLCTDRHLGLTGLTLGLGGIGSECLTVHGPTGTCEYVNSCRPFFPNKWPKVNIICDVPVNSDPLIVHSDDYIDIIVLTIATVLKNKGNIACSEPPLKKKYKKSTRDSNLSLPDSTPYIPPINIYICQFKKEHATNDNESNDNKIAIIECCISIECITATIDYFNKNHNDVSKMYHLFPPSLTSRNYDDNILAYYKLQWEKLQSTDDITHIYLDKHYYHSCAADAKNEEYEAVKTNKKNEKSTKMSKHNRDLSNINDTFVSFLAQLHSIAPTNFHRPNFVNDNNPLKALFNEKVLEVKQKLQYDKLNDNGKDDQDKIRVDVPEEEQQQVQHNTLELNKKAATKLRQMISTNVSPLRINDTVKNGILRSTPELVFLGTGSAAPSTLRNSSSIYLNMNKPFFSNILIDVGEGTYGQLVRLYGDEKSRMLINSLGVVWVSHHHIDHHLGLLRIIEERMFQFNIGNCNNDNAAKKTHNCSSNTKSIPVIKPLIIIGPPIVKHFLMKAAPRLFQYYQYFSFFEFSAAYHIHSVLYEELGITALINVPVHHCRDSHGLVLQLISGEKIVYSGDTRPCNNLVNAGSNATVLIHEATFDDTMAYDAKKKQHSTVSEALDVGKSMQAYSVILTHFSQRYPQIVYHKQQEPAKPIVKNEDVGRNKQVQNIDPILAFDMMHVNINDSDLQLACNSTKLIAEYLNRNS